jgi:leucyl-tRNA---protein transferase
VRRERLVYHGFQACPYLDGKVACLPLYRQEEPLDLDDADASFARAERRVGGSLYRTACPTCDACKGLRIVVQDFRPSASQRRVLKRWGALGDRLRVSMGPASVSDEKLALYNRHKIERGLDRRGEELTALEYEAWLVRSCVPTVEMTYRIDGRLVAVGIVDIGRSSASSVYFYFDPDPELARLSPGVYGVLAEVAWCARTRRRYHYLGLYVRDCPRLAYKADYHPHERLSDGDWRRFDGRELPVMGSRS